MSMEALVRILYSTSAMDIVTVGCNLLNQMIGESPNLCIIPKVDPKIFKSLF